ncbi:hypothetical protein LRS06_08910 [Hymenobacter sp. J193]|nr:hypothetical protein [Hymenobacter sp. J193]MCR5887895.1 hypothetical protein [Hymenobacter sp. J193]
MVRQLGHGPRRVAPTPVHQIVDGAGREGLVVALQLPQGAQYVLAGE